MRFILVSPVALLDPSKSCPPRPAGQMVLGAYYVNTIINRITIISVLLLVLHFSITHIIIIILIINIICLSSLIAGQLA